MVYSGDRAMVYRVEEDSGLMTVQDVTVGLSADGKIEITSGLAERDPVIVS